jgi:hypothetical protein
VDAIHYEQIPKTNPPKSAISRKDVPAAHQINYFFNYMDTWFVCRRRNVSSDAGNIGPCCIPPLKDKRKILHHLL